MSEAGVRGYSIVNWRGLLAPAGTPRDIVMRLNSEVAKTLKLAEVKQTLEREAYEPMGGTPEEFSALIKSEVASYAKLVRAADIRPE